MLMQTKDLTGPALDWAVAKAEGYLEPEERLGKMIPRVVFDMDWYGYDNKPMVRFNPAPDVYYRPDYAPSTDWETGGPIIEQHCMASSCFAPLPDSLHYDPANPTRKQWFYWNDRTGMVAGPTPLIAAMRCHVASKLGDTVEIPEELT